MPPAVMLVTLGGILVLVSAFAWLLYRLGGFRTTAQERRSWAVIGALQVVWVAVLAFIGPVPAPVSLLLTAGVLIAFGWAWRTGKFAFDRVPTDAQEEVARRRGWMRSHRGLVVALGIGFTLSLLAWSLAVALLTRPA